MCDIKDTTVRRFETTLTHKSLAASVRNKSSDGGWSVDTMERAKRTVAFPRNAATDRRMFKAEIRRSLLGIPLVSASEQSKSFSVSSCWDLEVLVSAIKALFIGVTSMQSNWSKETYGWFLKGNESL